MPETLETRVTVVETRLDTLMETLAHQLHTMNERMNDIRAWLIALTTLAGIQLATMVTLAIVVLRR